MERLKITQRTTRKAFTLIELLVVIAIISLLVSILLPTLKKAKDLAKWTICQANLRSVGLALNMYITENDGYIPPRYGGLMGNEPGGYVAQDGNTYYNWYQGVLMTFWDSGGMTAHQPRDGNGILHLYTGSSKTGLNAIFTCPALEPGPQVLTWGGTAYNTWISGKMGFGLNYRHVTPQTAGELVLKVDEVNRPSELIYMADGSGWTLDIYDSLYPSSPYPPEMYTAGVPADRHFGNFDMVFCDGTVNTGPLDEFYEARYMERNWSEY